MPEEDLPVITEETTPENTPVNLGGINRVSLNSITLDIDLDKIDTATLRQNFNGASGGCPLCHSVQYGIIPNENYIIAFCIDCGNIYNKGFINKGD